jgi:GNAT superfamily N-acetyltransferase
MTVSVKIAGMEPVLSAVALDSQPVRELLAARAREYEVIIPGWTPATASVVDPDDFRPPRGVFLVAFDGPRALGCGGVRTLSDGLGEVKRMYVLESERGHGIGRRLLIALEQRARDLGLARMRLDSHGNPAALALYHSSGYRPIDDYSGNSNARHWFEKPLV